MPDRIIHLRSLTPGSTPTTSSLGVGELAINVPDGKIYLRKSGSNGDAVQAAITTNSNNAGNVILSGSLAITGSISILSGSVTSSLFGTASWASNSTTSSYITWANVDETTTDTFAGTSSYSAKAASLLSGVNINVTQVTASSIQVTNLNVVTITSSIEYASGSNIFGTKSTDTQQFTGCYHNRIVECKRSNRRNC